VGHFFFAFSGKNQKFAEKIFLAFFENFGARAPVVVRRRCLLVLLAPL